MAGRGFVGITISYILKPSDLSCKICGRILLFSASLKSNLQKIQFLAISTFSPICYLQMVWGCMCACAFAYSTGMVQNELIRRYANVVHTSSSFHPLTHTFSFEDHELAGLKVGPSFYCVQFLRDKCFRSTIQQPWANGRC